MAKFSEQILRRFSSIFIKRSLSVCSWFYVEGLLPVIFNQLEKKFKRKTLYIKEKKPEAKDCVFLLFSFLWGMLEVPVLLSVAGSVSLRAPCLFRLLEQTCPYLKPCKITGDSRGRGTGAVINTWLEFCKGICLAWKIRSCELGLITAVPFTGV